MNDAITPFTLAVPQADLEDLNRRIDQTRWPDAETVDDWTQGAPLAKVLGMLGSTSDGEVMVAARQAERLRLETGLNWAELIARYASTK